MPQIDVLKTRRWIQNLDEEKFSAQFFPSLTREAFWILWNIYQFYEEKVESVARSFADNALSNLRAIEAKDVPLLGFLIFLDVTLDLPLPFPKPYEIAENMCEDTRLAELAFCVYLLKKRKYNALCEFSKELGRCLFFKDVSYSIEETIKNYPIENSREILSEILKDFYIPREPYSTFAEMIRLEKKYLEDIQKTKMSFSQLMKYFYATPKECPLFKSSDDFKTWFNLGLKHGIFSEFQVQHHKNPPWKVYLISLNEEGIIRFFEGNYSEVLNF